jgi:hypothetical protein
MQGGFLVISSELRAASFLLLAARGSQLRAALQPPFVIFLTNSPHKLPYRLPKLPVIN